MTNIVIDTNVLVSAALSERELTISFSMDELEAMEGGEIPRRALDFLEKHRGELADD